MTTLAASSVLWQSHLDARATGAMPPPPSSATDKGRAMCKAVLEQARAMSSRTASTPQNRAQFIGLTSWRDTSYEYRRMLAVMASLPPSVADKTDRDLSETEKTMLRAAAKRVSEGISGLAASL